VFRRLGNGRAVWGNVAFPGDPLSGPLFDESMGARSGVWYFACLRADIIQMRRKGANIMTDTLLKHEGLNVLAEHLGPVDMECFLVLMSREQADYTAWRKSQPDTLIVREYRKRAMDYQKTLS
jgi:hypothetical protein